MLNIHDMVLGISNIAFPRIDGHENWDLFPYGNELTETIKTPTQLKAFSALYIDVPGDGSCFYHCIAKAFQDNRKTFDKNLKKIIDGYMIAYLFSKDIIDVDDMNEKTSDLYAIDADLIRYICGINIDDEDLEYYNHIAMANNNNTFNTKKDLVDSIIDSNDFADFVEIRTLITKGFQNVLGIFIIDHSIKDNIVHFPKEWTDNKKYNIILERKNLHYRLVQIIKNNTRQNTLINHKTAIKFIDNYNI